MSLWTPSGEHPVGDDRPTQRAGQAAGDAPTAAPTRGPGAPDGGSAGSGHHDRGHDEEGGAPELDALRRQLAEAPAEVVITNHCYGLFELAAVYLSDSPPHLESARLAIDALGFLVDGLGERLGEGYPPLRDALAQMRLAFVQIATAQEHAEQPAGAPDGAGPD